MEPAKNTTAFWNRDYFKLISTKSFNGLKIYAQLYIMALTALNPGHKIMIWNMLCCWLIQNFWLNFGKYEEHPFWSISISPCIPNTLQLTSSAGEGRSESWMRKFCCPQIAIIYDLSNIQRGMSKIPNTEFFKDDSVRTYKCLQKILNAPST